MGRSDFNYIEINQTFTAANPVAEFPFEVELSSGPVVGDAVGAGYLLITVRSVDSQDHRIEINDIDLKGDFDIPLPPGNSDAWLTYMDRIEPNVLRQGTNTLRITRVGNDNFVVRDVVVHWREFG
jgi:hypothetical protein